MHSGLRNFPHLPIRRHLSPSLTMPSPIAHSVTGYALTHLLPQKVQSNNHQLQKLYPILSPLALYAVVVSNVPDLDFLPQLITQARFHRGPTHSLFIGLLLSFILSVLAKPLLPKIAQALSHLGTQPPVRHRLSYRTLFTFTLSLYLAHLFIDSVTAGGPGMQLFWPLSDGYFRAPFSLFPGVHHSRGLWDNSHIIFITAETIYSIVVISTLKFLHIRNPYKNQPIEK